MTLGGANVWSNFYYGNYTYAPSGCLLNPQGSLLIFFEKSIKSSKNNIRIFTYMFYADHFGNPAGLKNTEIHDIDSAFKKWDKLINFGWTEVDQHFG